MKETAKVTSTVPTMNAEEEPEQPTTPPGWLPRYHGGGTVTTGHELGATFIVGGPPWSATKAYTAPGVQGHQPPAPELRRYRVTRQEYGATVTRSVEVEACRVVTEDGQVKFYRGPYDNSLTYACALKGFLELQEITGEAK